MNSLQPRAIRLINLKETQTKVMKKSEISDKGVSARKIIPKMSSKKGSLLLEDIEPQYGPPLGRLIMIFYPSPIPKRYTAWHSADDNSVSANSLTLAP